MRVLLFALVAACGASAFAQTQTEDTFTVIGRRLNMTPGSVRAMWKRQGILAQVGALFPAQMADEALLVGDEAAPLAAVILQNDQAKAPGVTLVDRLPLDLPADVDTDDLLLAKVAKDGRTYHVACAAFSAGRSSTPRGRLYHERSARVADATTDAGPDDETLRQVQRLIKDLRTADYVCYQF